MSFVLFSLCSPFFLSMLIFLAALSLVMPGGAVGLSGLFVACAPLLAVVVVYTWLEQVSTIVSKLGIALKNGILLLTLLFFINEDNYFRMIAISQRSLPLNSGMALHGVLSILSVVLMYSALGTLLLILTTLIVELSVRLVAGTYFPDLGGLMEGLKFALIVTAVAFAAGELLKRLTLSF